MTFCAIDEVQSDLDYPDHFVSSNNVGQAMYPDSPVATGSFGGLISPNKAPTPQIEYETPYISGVLVKF